MSDIIKPDFEKQPDIDKAFHAFLFTNIKDIVDKCCDDNSFQKLAPLVDKMDALRKQLFIVNRFDHAEPLLSTVKRLQEENEQLKEACIEALKHHQGGHSEIGHKLSEAIKKSSELNK